MSRTADHAFEPEKLQPSNPNISIPHRVFVILQAQRLLGWMRDVQRRPVVVGDPVDLDVALNQYSVVQHRDARTINDLSLLIEPRRVKDNVVRLPLTGLSRRIHEWRMLLVNGAGLSVVVRLVVV